MGSASAWQNYYNLPYWLNLPCSAKSLFRKWNLFSLEWRNVVKKMLYKLVFFFFFQLKKLMKPGCLEDEVPKMNSFPVFDKFLLLSAAFGFVTAQLFGSCCSLAEAFACRTSSIVNMQHCLMKEICNSHFALRYSSILNSALILSFTTYKTSS